MLNPALSMEAVSVPTGSCWPAVGANGPKHLNELSL